MSFCGKLPFNFKYSESPRKDTMLQNILQTSPETPWKLAPPKLAQKENLPLSWPSLPRNISRQPLQKATSVSP